MLPLNFKFNQLFYSAPVAPAPATTAVATTPHASGTQQQQLMKNGLK